jgi:hypothetical protein
MTAARAPRVGRPLLAWVLGGLTVGLAITSVIVAIADPSSAGPDHVGRAGPTADDRVTHADVLFPLLQAIVFSACALVGSVVAARRPRNAVGWLFGAAAFSWEISIVGNQLYWYLAFARPGDTTAADLVAWFVNWAWIPAALLLFGLIPLLFPTGAPPGTRWRKVGWTVAGAGAVAVVSTALAPGPLKTADFPWIDNPVGVGGLGLGTVAQLSLLVSLAAALLAVASLVVRYRRSRGVERLQLRWVAAAGCVLVLSVGPGSTLASAWISEGAGWAAILFGLLTMAGAVGVALLRYRLYDIDVVINRALVYGALTATLAGIYLGTVLLLQLALNGVTGDSGLAVAASTLAVAALFRPARARIQDLVDRRFYRRKYDAGLTLAAFSAHLRDEVALDAVASELRSVVMDTMQPAHVSLWLRGPL